MINSNEAEIDILRRTSPDELEGGGCKIHNCTFFHICKDYRSGNCRIAAIYHDNTCHVQKTCNSITKQVPCLSGERCKFPHDHPDIRLAIFLQRRARGARSKTLDEIEHQRAQDWGSAERLRAHDARRRKRQMERLQKSGLSNR